MYFIAWLTAIPNTGRVTAVSIDRRKQGVSFTVEGLQSPSVHCPYVLKNFGWWISGEGALT